MPLTTTGQVITVNHPLVTLSGLTTVRPGTILETKEGVLGQVTAFTPEQVEVMIFSSQPLPIGTKMSVLHDELSISVSAQMLGYVIDPLGKSWLEQETPLSHQRQLLDAPPLGLPNRARVTEQLITGTGLVDLLLPLGKGQRELVVGDQTTGKTQFLQHTAITQAKRGTIVIWAAIGRKRSEIKQLHAKLDKAGIMDQTIVVASSAQDPASIVYLTPFTAMSLAEYFRDQGLDALVILDDLSTHAKFYREIALLGRRFPGRESYPGDIFYTHARLLERAGSFIHPSRPSATVTISCLPVAETTETDLTSYITSNLISITDGHLLFDTSLFSRGLRPAIHTGLSVTRVGKQTQTLLQRELSRELTSFMATYAKTQQLTHFGAELTSTTQDILNKGVALESFFEQTNDFTFESHILLVGATMIWQGWWNENDRVQIQKRRNCLFEQSQQSKTKAFLDQLVASPNLEAFVKELHTHRDHLETLCHA